MTIAKSPLLAIAAWLITGCPHEYRAPKSSPSEKPSTACMPHSLLPEAEPLLAAAAAEMAVDYRVQMKGALTRQRDWTMERNQETGILVGRSVEVTIYYHDPKDQRCYLIVGWLFQDSQGGSRWGRPRFNSGHGQCDAVGNCADDVHPATCESMNAPTSQWRPCQSF